jgi:hypothetical protein
MLNREKDYTKDNIIQDVYTTHINDKTNDNNAVFLFC